ncbi:hypothetical protein MAR_029768 [Mya arenaria]|uniref:Uncharacterized protein n=1 Tax=Mya arenaria TaxID=6604 RepID=A0ABY7DLZ2_MYAAR|nr:hypothetical protein MAR_029768 [Mya arenaria]
MATNSPPLITNKDIIEQFKKTNRSECVNWLMSAHSCEVKPTQQSYLNIVNKSIKTFLNLNKSKSRPEGKQQLEKFLNNDVDFPKASTHLRKPKEKDVSCDCSYKVVSLDLALELQTVKLDKKKIELEFENLKSQNIALKRSKISKSTLNKLNDSLKHKTVVIKSLQASLDRERATLRRIRLQNSRRDSKIHELKEHIILLESKIDIMNESIVEKDEAVENLDEQLKSAQTDLTDARAEVDWLADIANELDSVSFYDSDSNKYSHKLRQCIYHLLSLNVSAQNVSVGKTVDKLPCKSTILSCNVERLILSQQQLKEQLPDKENLTLYTDETTKFGTKYSGYHTSDTDGNMYVLGMREILTKSGQDTLSSFEEILNDIDERTVDADLTSKRILLNITATMSDRASTEKNFNNLLQELRNTILPEMYEHWDHLTAENQVAASTILNFFCGLHSLIHFAETSNKTLIQVENGFFDINAPILDPSFRKQSESGTLRLVRTSCKALARGADEKSGKFKEFNIFVKDFLKENKLHSLPLEPFHGNRFNILFESAVAVFFLKDKIREFLLFNDSNKLLKSVLHDIQIIEYLAGLKALGLVSRLITGPLWCLIEKTPVHILDMNTHYLALVNFFKDASQNINLFMTGNLLLFGEETELNKDAMFDSLTLEWEHDDKVEVFLQVIFPALRELSNRIFVDHLPGGKWENVTDDVRAKSISCQKHNKFAESVFRFLDQLLRKKPNISDLASEAYIMYTANKTQQWLTSKTEEEKQTLITDAMKNVKTINFKTRHSEIELKQRQMMQEKLVQIELAEARRVKRLENYTNQVLYFGLWQTEECIEKELSEISKKVEKIKALKAQLNFRQYVLKQKLPNNEEHRHVYAHSKSFEGRRIPASVEVLANNVKKLIQHAFTIEPPTGPVDANKPILNGKKIKHRFEENGEEKWYNGTVISQVKTIFISSFKGYFL